MVEEVHVVVAPFDWHHDGLRYRRHRLAEYLSRREEVGAVVWVSPVTASPRRPFEILKVRKEIKKSGSNLRDHPGLLCFLLPDIIPGRIMRLGRLFHIKRIKALRELVYSLGEKRYLWFTAPAFPFLAELCRWDRVVYDCSDNWGLSLEGRQGIKEKLDKLWVKSKAEELIVERSDLLFATSEYLRDKMKSFYGREALVVENGVELDLFHSRVAQSRVELSGLPGDGEARRLGYVGGMKEKIDFNLLYELMRERNNWHLLLVGPAPQGRNRELERLTGLENVHFLGGVEPWEVPGCLEKLEVGLLPYKKNDYNRAVFPLKLYEYMAAGVPVVGSGVPSTCRVEEEGLYLHVNGDIKDFAGACEKALAWSSDSKLIKRRKSVAAAADWEKKLDFMTQAVREGRF